MKMFWWENLFLSFFKKKFLLEILFSHQALNNAARIRNGTNYCNRSSQSDSIPSQKGSISESSIDRGFKIAGDSH